MPSLTLDQLEKRYDGHVAVAAVSLTIREGEFVSLLGPSGCGKTTVLRMVAGLIEPTGGRVLIDDRDITRMPPNKRQIGLVFQSYALFPHMTVYENVAYGLRRQGLAGGALEQQVHQALESVRLTGYAQRMPRQLSGGQQQRVALARAIAPRPRILLLDEPLSNLDATLRDEMQIELKRLQRSVGITTVFVTHDQTEAMAMSDRVCVLAHGVVQQFGTPEEVYHRPATGFVARFIGRPNRVAGRVGEVEAGRDGRVVLPGGIELVCSTIGHLDAGAHVEAVLRQEDLQLVASTDVGARPNVFPARLLLRAFSGARVQYVLAIADGLELVAEVATNGPNAGHSPGEVLHVAIDPAHVYVNAAELPA